MVKVFTFYPIWNVKWTGTMPWFLYTVDTHPRIFCCVFCVVGEDYLTHYAAACDPLNDHRGAEYLEVFICIGLMPIIGCYQTVETLLTILLSQAD